MTEEHGNANGDASAGNEIVSADGIGEEINNTSNTSADDASDDDSSDTDGPIFPANTLRENSLFFNCTSTAWGKLVDAPDAWNLTAKDLQVVPYVKTFHTYTTLGGDCAWIEGYEFTRFQDILKWDEAWEMLAKMPALYEHEDSSRVEEDGESEGEEDEGSEEEEAEEDDGEENEDSEEQEDEEDSN